MCEALKQATGRPRILTTMPTMLRSSFLLLGVGGGVLGTGSEVGFVGSSLVVVEVEDVVVAIIASVAC